tara:strand:+ start:1550 stop:2215 length:666 start_codon:yes stop_codon:yes gene_type:complete
MTLPSSGVISLNSIQGEFGGSNPIGLNEYYRGGGLVPNHSNTSSIPTSGTIDAQDFYGTSATSPIDLTHNINMRQFKQGAGKFIFDMYGYSTNVVPNTGTPSASDTSIVAGGFSASIIDSNKLKGTSATNAAWQLGFSVAGIAQYLYQNYSGATFQGLGFQAWNNTNNDNSAGGLAFTPPNSSATTLVWGGITRANYAAMGTTFDNWAAGRLNSNTSIVIS